MYGDGRESEGQEGEELYIVEMGNVPDEANITIPVLVRERERERERWELSHKEMVKDTRRK